MPFFPTAAIMDENGLIRLETPADVTLAESNDWPVYYFANGEFSAVTDSTPLDAVKYADLDFRRLRCTVTFNSEGGSSVSAVHTAEGTSITLPAAPTRSGYTFVDWFTAASGGSEAPNPYTVTSNVTLYAQWELNTTFTVTYNYESGSGSPSSAVYSGAPLILPTPSYTGHTFNGWYTASSGGTLVGAAGASYTPSASITLYAQYSADVFTVTYNYEGGTGTPASVNFTYGSSPLVLPTPTYSGHVFNGWYTATVGGTFLGDGGALYTPLTNVTIYAQWTADVYTVTYNYEGGTGSPASASYTVGGAALVLPTPTYSGYTFNGWYPAPSGGTLIGAGGASYRPTASSTIYAQWTAIPTYTVTYNYEGGTGSPASATYTVGGSPLVLPTPTRTGYTFAGWFTAASGGTELGAAGASYTPSAAITAYAQWTADVYTVTYDYEGGTGSPASANYTVGGSPLTLPTPTYSGYTFDGWFTAASGGTEIGEGGGSYTPTASITLYAQWSVATGTPLPFDLGVNESNAFGLLTEVLSALQPVGMKWCRSEVPWNYNKAGADEEVGNGFETTAGSYNSTVAAAIAAERTTIESYGFTPLFLIDIDAGSTLTSTWTSGPPTTAAQYGAACGWLVAQSGLQGCHWEIMNEPDGSAQGITAALYVEALEAAYTAMKAADPTCTVHAFALSAVYSEVGTGGSQYYEACYAINSTLYNYYDVADFHTYSNDDSYVTDAPPSFVGPSGVDIYNGIAMMQQIRIAKGDTKPFWLTEIGWPNSNAGTMTPTLQAEYFQDLLTVLSGYDSVNDCDYSEYLRALLIYAGDNAGAYWGIMGSPDDVSIAIPTLTALVAG
jgi:uncharacterized repeat protein (TIGR02543 family)